VDGRAVNGLRYHVRHERGLLDAGWLRARFSFSFGGYEHPQGDRFGPLVALNEDEVQPGSGFPWHTHRDLEILMLPLAGQIANEDSLGLRHTFGPGEVLMMRAGSGIRHSQFNPSNEVLDRHLQVWIAPAVTGLPPRVQLRQLPPPKLGEWRLVAAPEGESALFTLAQQARVCLGAAGEGRPLELVLAPGDAAFVHLVAGSSEAILPGGVERLMAGEALAIESTPAPITLRAVGQGAEFVVVAFPASLLLRNRTNAVVRAGT
jgi:redox-sensitive bicupin YhaK (pirin superfamily)